MPLAPLEDYLLKVPDPVDDIRKNMEAVQNQQSALRDNVKFGYQVQDAQRVQEAERQKAIEHAAFRADATALAANPTPDATVRMMEKWPEYAEKYKTSLEQLNAKERDAMVGPLMNIYNAFLSKRPDLAKKDLETLATAYENSGKANYAAGARQALEIMKTNPGAAITPIAGMVAQALGPEKFLAAYKQFIEQPTELEGKEADTKKKVIDAQKEARLVESQIKENTAQAGSADATAGLAKKNTETADFDLKFKKKTESDDLLKHSADATKARIDISEKVREGERQDKELKIKEDELGLKKEKNKVEIDEIKARVSKLAPDAFKQMNTFREGAEKMREGRPMVDKLFAGYEKIAAQGGNKGGVTKAMDFLRAAVGKENEDTMTRKMFDRMTSKEVLEDLRGLGKMTDTEFKVMKRGFLDSSGDEKLILEYLKTLRTVMARKEKIDDAKADWVEFNGTTGTAKNDMVIGGKKVEKGTPLRSFIDQLIPMEQEKSNHTEMSVEELLQKRAKLAGLGGK